MNTHTHTIFTGDIERGQCVSVRGASERACVCVCVFGVQWRVMVLCMCSHHRETIVV